MSSPLELMVAMLNEAYGTGASVSDDGALHLHMAESLSVSIATSPDQRDLVFYAPLADLLRGRSVALMGAALGVNLHQDRTRGGAIAADLTTQTLIFNWRWRAEGAEPDALAWALENFCATALELRAFLEDAVSEFSEAEGQELDSRLAADDAWAEPTALEASESHAHQPAAIIKG